MAHLMSELAEPRGIFEMNKVTEMLSCNLSELF